MYGPFQPAFNTPFFVIEEAHPFHEKDVHPYYRLTSQNSVICCLLTEDDQFVMVEQFRPNLGLTTLETPAGSIDDNETPLDAARREILEETGFESPLLPLGHKFSLMMNRTNIYDYLFFGMFPTISPHQKTEPGIKTRYIPRNELKDLSINGGYLQIAGLAILQLASIVLKVDIFESSLDDISSSFKRCPHVHWL